MLTTNGRNQLLDATDIDFLSLHTDFPGQTQANEVAGGSPAYARKAVTWAAASSGSKATSNAPVFDVPAATTVKWVGFSDAVTSGNGRACAPNGASPKEFTVDATNNQILSLAHGYADTQKITFYGGTPPAPLVEGTTYFVRDSTTDNFKVAATSGGSAIDLTAQATSDCVMSVIVEETFAAQGTFTVNSGSTIALTF
jgi:hypothetical protein